MSSDKSKRHNKIRRSYYIFSIGKNKRVGRITPHRKDNGLNLHIGNARYVAFPIKDKHHAEENKHDH